MGSENVKPPRLQAPIVLAHGLLGFSRLEVGGYSLVSYFRLIPEFLEQGGNRVALTTVPPAGSVASRAEALKREIQKRFGEEPIHLIAHSMGGLDARHMITHLETAKRVLTLTTLGTPHRGTVFADRGVELAERFNLLAWIAKLGISSEAFRDLKTEVCRKFNEATPDSPAVRYFSVAGDKKREEMFFPLRYSHDVIAPVEGPNDGLVAVQSARWGERFTVWNCDHINLVGWTSPREQLSGYTFDVKTGYSDILKRLVECGF